MGPLIYMSKGLGYREWIIFQLSEEYNGWSNNNTHIYPWEPYRDNEINNEQSPHSQLLRFRHYHDYSETTRKFGHRLN